MHNGLQRHVTGVMYVSRGVSMVQCICIKKLVYQYCNVVSRGISMVQCMYQEVYQWCNVCIKNGVMYQ